MPVHRDPLRLETRLGRSRTTKKGELVLVEDKTLVREDHSGLRADAFKSINSTFEEVNFEGMKIGTGSFGAGKAMSIYRRCIFDGARIQGPNIGRARFEDCSFRDVRLKHWFCFDTEFVDCVFSGVGEGLVFFGRPEDDSMELLDRSVNEFRDNDFQGMELRDCAFRRGIRFADQRLPEAENYVVIEQAQDAIVHARKEVTSWQEDDDRRYGLALLNDLMKDVEQGQDELFINLKDANNDEVRRRVLALMAE